MEYKFCFWKLFEHAIAENTCFEIEVSTVPFPRGPLGNILAFDDDIAPEDAQKAISVALKKYYAICRTQALM